jgi:hypothetical protein
MKRPKLPKTAKTIAVPLRIETYEFILSEARKERRTLAGYVRIQLEDHAARAGMIVEDSTPAANS